MVRSACLIGVLGFAMSALAQEAAPVSPYPPPPPPPAAGPAPAAAIEPAAPGAVATTPAPAKSGIRLRGGIGLGLGVFNAGPQMYGATLEGAVGAQFNDLFGAYVLLGGLTAGSAWLTANTSGAGLSGSVVSYTQLAAFGDVLIADKFFIALGPTVVNGGWLGGTLDATTSGGRVTAFGASGWIPGVAARLGYAGGADRRDAVTGRRSGLTVSLDFGVLFGKQSSAAVDANTKGGSVGIQLDQPVMGIPVMLVVGYEWR